MRSNTYFLKMLSIFHLAFLHNQLTIHFLHTMPLNFSHNQHFKVIFKCTLDKSLKAELSSAMTISYSIQNYFLKAQLLTTQVCFKHVTERLGTDIDVNILTSINVRSPQPYIPGKGDCAICPFCCPTMQDNQT